MWSPGRRLPGGLPLLTLIALLAGCGPIDPAMAEHVDGSALLAPELRQPPAWQEPGAELAASPAPGVEPDAPAELSGARVEAPGLRAEGQAPATDAPPTRAGAPADVLGAPPVQAPDGVTEATGEPAAPGRDEAKAPGAKAPEVVPPTRLPARSTLPTVDPRPTLEEYARQDMTYDVLLHWKNRRKWGTATSMGDPLHGSLPGGVPLSQEGQHHTILTMCRERATNYGSPRLLELIDHAARTVHGAQGGPRLQVCNMSIEGGGPMRWSRSHAAGRDVDFGFFVRREGKPAELNTLLTFKNSLERVVDDVTWTFDVPRNWALVKALLTWPDAQIQWIFMANHLRRAVLDHAEAQGEPLELLIRARQIVRQPGDSTPHDDHIHVRIYCEPDERIHGCRDMEPWWPWIGTRDGELALRAAALSLGLRDRSKDMRLLAFERIEARRLYDASPALAEVALMDPSGDQQARAMDILTDWQRRNAEVSYALERFVRAPGADGVRRDDPAFTAVAPALTPEVMAGPCQPWVIGQGKKRRASHIIRAYVLLGRLGAPESARFLADAVRSRRLIGDQGQGVPEALLAARAARHVMSVELVPALIDALEHDSGEVREAAIEALRRITNHTFSRPWGDKAGRERLAEGVALWRGWWATRASHDREQLLREGFAARGVTLDPWRKDEVIVQLVRAMDKDDPLAYNADRLLSWLTGRTSILDATSGAKRQRWREWIGLDD